jgi:chorismate mutase
MAERGDRGDRAAGAAGARGGGHGTPGARPLDPDARAEAVSTLEGLRREIDALDVRIVALLNERARLGLAVGQAKLEAGWSGIRDPKREREVLQRVTMANAGPLPQPDLVAIYRRLIAATRSLEDADRSPVAPDEAGPSAAEPDPGP